MVLPADRTGIQDLGAVSEADKHRLLAGCVALFNPSVNESYSRVLMEAWHYARPIVAHADCLATAAAVLDSGGGWLAGSEGAWMDAFVRVDRAAAEEMAALGAAGRVYAQEYGDWETAISRYEAAIASWSTRWNLRPTPSWAPSIRWCPACPMATPFPTKYCGSTGAPTSRL